MLWMDPLLFHSRLDGPFLQSQTPGQGSMGLA